MTCPADLEQRLAQQEAALIHLSDRLALLERAFAFEVGQREAMEQILLQLTGVPKRMDRIEAEARAARRRSPA